MRSISTLLILLHSVFIAPQVQAAIVSGNVRDINTSQVVAGQTILVSDVSFTFSASGTSDASGNYAITLPASLAVNTVITVWTNACDQTDRQNVVYTGSNITLNYNLCSNNRYILQGRVQLSGLPRSHDPAMVYLIRKDYNPLTMDTTLTAIDSVTTGAAFSIDFYKYYSTVPTGDLYLKVALMPSHASYASYPPTYYHSALRWSGATPLNNRSFISDTTEVLMMPGVNPGGNGFLGGSVLVGANKGTAIGDPLANRIILLTNGAGQTDGYTYSDATGHFGFSNLAYGTYKMFGDAMGKSNPDFTITLSPNNPTINAILFEENDTSFHGSYAGLSVLDHPLARVSVSSSLNSEYLTVNGLSHIEGDKILTLMNATGSVMQRAVIPGNAAARLNTPRLPAGIYLLEVLTAKGSARFKLIR